MTKSEQQRIALALLGSRPAVMPGTKAIINRAEQVVWYRSVTTVADAVFNGQPVPAWFFDTAGVPD